MKRVKHKPTYRDAHVPSPPITPSCAPVVLLAVTRRSEHMQLHLGDGRATRCVVKNKCYLEKKTKAQTKIKVKKNK